MKSLVALALASTSWALPASAELMGGEIGLNYGVLTGVGDEDVSDARLHGWVDYGFSSDAGLQAGFAFDQLSYDDGNAEAEGDIRSFDLHAYYRLETARVGAFIGRSDLGEFSVSGLGSIDVDLQLTTYGVEYDVDSGPLTVGLQVGRAEVDDVGDLNAGLIGLDASVALSDRFALLGAYDRIGFGSEDDDESDAIGSLSTYTAGAEFYATPSIALSAFAGRTSAESGEVEEDATVYGVGVSYVFGSGSANRQRPFSSFSSTF